MDSAITRIPLDLRWRDLDAFGHLNNASTVSLFEEARIRWFTACVPDWDAEASGPVVAALTVNYRHPVHYPQTLVAELAVARAGTSSLTLTQRILAADDAVHADGEVVLVWVDRHSGRPSPLPATLRERLGAG